MNTKECSMNAIVKLAVSILLCLITLHLNAEGLSEYLQNPDISKTSLETTTAISSNISTASDTSLINLPKDTTQLKNIIELVVAGIVAAALIICILVIFLGKWIAGREKKLIKQIRIDAEESAEHITSATTSIREQEKETTKITQTIRSQANELSVKQKETEQYTNKIIDTSKQVEEQQKEIDSVSNKVSENMNKIQKYWDNQVNDTVDTISLFQHNLNENISIASEELNKISEQKNISSELMEDLLNKQHTQNTLIEDNSELSQKVSANLQQAYTESNKLLELLKQQQDKAELSLNEYSERLNTFEEQAYEQFDTSFQVADLARQELSANLEENRKHIETIRRQEEQSHGINNQIAKNLETLDYSKIKKISETLDTTQNMFDDIHNKVEETRLMLDELKRIEKDVKTTASNVENAAQDISSKEKDFDKIKQQDDIDEQIEKQIDDIIENSKDALDTQTELANEEFKKHQIAKDDGPKAGGKPFEEKGLSERLSTAKNNDKNLDKNTVEKIKANTTVAITDYKMANGNTSTPLSFFRDIQKNSKSK